MTQSKKKSLLEAIVSTFVGFLVTLAASPFIYNLCDVKMNYSKMTTVTLLFTIVSILKGYVIRRWFNKLK